MLRGLASLGALSALFALSGWTAEIVPTAKQSPEPPLGSASASVADEMVEAVPLEPAAIVISEGTFTALLARRGEAVSLPARHGAAVLAANLADPVALGVIANLVRGPTHIRSNLFIVLRDPALSRDGKVEGRNTFVAAVELAGRVPWFGRSPRLAVSSSVQPAGACRDVPRGCRPIFDARSRGAVPLRFSSSRADAAGLPPEVLLNLESGAPPPNASGQRPRLLVFGADPAQRPSTYECHAPVGWDQCPDELRVSESEAARPKHTAPLPKGALLIGEGDFLAALSQGEPEPAREHDAVATRRLLVLANSDEAMGISAQHEPTQTFSGELFAVARNPVLGPDGRVSATEYYMVPVRLSGHARWLGRLPGIGFRDEIPSVVEGPCGLIATPTDIPSCDRPPCGGWTIPLGGGPPIGGGEGPPPAGGGGPPGYSVEGGEPRYGSDRWPSGSRVTMRVPTFDTGRRLADFSAIACSDRVSPPERIPNPGGCGNNEVEICNGVDDDCNGDIDEKDVCASRATDCTCTPKTCAELGVTCGVAHDGCNTLLTCGAPCP